jgi:hypothetical protein
MTNAACGPALPAARVWVDGRRGAARWRADSRSPPDPPRGARRSSPVRLAWDLNRDNVVSPLAMKVHADGMAPWIVRTSATAANSITVAPAGKDMLHTHKDWFDSSCADSGKPMAGDKAPQPRIHPLISTSPRRALVVHSAGDGASVVPPTHRRAVGLAPQREAELLRPQSVER